MIITDVLLYEVFGRMAVVIPSPSDRQAQQLDIYPEFNAHDWARARQSGIQDVRALYVEIVSDEIKDGKTISGLFGPIEAEQAFIISKFLRSYLLGRDPLATETLSDQMMRLHRHGRSGLFMTGVSAVDCALWDLKGKAWGQPLYRLLGGPTRLEVPAYASMLGFSVEPEIAAQTAIEYQKMGFPAQKWFFRYGPGDGAMGLAKNISLIRALRKALGPHYPLMADAFMGWDYVYTAEMIRKLESYHLEWLEEPIPPERIGIFKSLKSNSRLPLATGEHVYTRWQVKELLDSGVIDWVQTDPDWCGGVSELVKICSLASSYGVPVVAHGHSLLAALHIAGSQPPDVVPYIEYLIQHQAYKQYFHIKNYQPENGLVKLPDLPGLGLVLDDGKIIQRRDYQIS
jgi:L-alanine-DL-glutamate epimerase-like enolase superfamily enzyme